MKRHLLILLALLPTWAEALTVTVSTYPNYCSTPGWANANPSGGVPPYTYLWSSGETTQGISPLGGNYTVTVTDFEGTQVTEPVTVFYYDSYPQVYQAYNRRAYCDPGATPVVLDITLMNESYQFYPVLPLDLSPAIYEAYVYGLYNYVLVVDAGVPGGSALLNYVDAGGCPGSVVVGYGYTVDFPVLGLLGVEGTCGASTGSITVAASPEGHNQAVDLELKNAGGQVLTTRSIGNGTSTQVFSGLAAGDYWLVQRVPYMGNGFWGTFLRGQCGDSLMVTVPDLGPGCGNVNGTVYMDYNEDCVMGSAGAETRVPGAILEFMPGPYYATANSSGVYSINLATGAYTVQQIAADIAQHCPAPPAPVNVNGVQTLNIADTSLVPLDAQVTMASGPARPGFELHYAIEQRNLTPASTGTTVTTFTFDPAVSYISATPAPSNVSGNVLMWNQTALGAFQQRSIQVRLQVPSDVGLIGTVLNASVVLTTANSDVVSANNSAGMDVTITASFDPNEKVVATSSGSSATQYFIDVDNWVDYTIRFQNTGTDTAFTVIVTDTLPTTLDPATIQWGAASHDCMRSLAGQGVVKFIFPNILLLDSNVNEAASHGFASFRIRPRLPLLAGTVIENTANIFFDFNPAVITEPSVLIAEFSTGTSDTMSEGLRLFPNPVNDHLTLVSDFAIRSLNILSADGRSVIILSAQGTRCDLDMSGLPAGAYTVVLYLTNGERIIRPFIKY